MFKKRKPFFLNKEFFPNTQVGNKSLSYFRTRLLNKKNSNLNFLIENRFNWIKKYITKQEIGIEVGCGIGASKMVLAEYNYTLSDCYELPWTDLVVDAMSLPFEDESLDYILISNVIHHLATPMKFFDEANRVLKSKGKIIMIDVNCSLCMRFILKTLKHEGYSYNRDPFNRKIPCNNPNEPWSGNNAVTDLLLFDPVRFKEETKFKIIHNKPFEFLIFLLSGGVSSEFKTINLPEFCLRIFSRLDLFVSYFSSIFPLSKKIVLQK